MFNSIDDSSIIVRAEGPVQSQSFTLKDTKGHVLLRDHEILDTEELLVNNKVCIVEPNYTSYQIYIPKHRSVYISFMEGNFYSENFEGNLNLKIEDGIIKLKDMQYPVNVSLNTGTVFLKDIRNTEIDAATNLGILMNNTSTEDKVEPQKKVFQTIGKPNNSIVIRTILANIYLYGSKD